MQPARLPILISTVLTGIIAITAACGSAGKEFLTEREIAQVQDAQEIDRRVEVYLRAAALRLKTAEERLFGKESEPGDPLEFFTVEDMLDGYYRIMRSVMLNLDSAFQKPDIDRSVVKKALKELKQRTERSAKNLDILKRVAEDKRKDALWNLVEKAVEITAGAYEGALLGLSRESESKAKDKEGIR